MKKSKPKKFYLLSIRKPLEFDLVLWKDSKERTCPGWMQNGRPIGNKLHTLKGELSWQRYCHFEN